MPLDNLQKAILRILLKNRSPDSVFAGGSVLHRHGHRISADQDIFHTAAADLVATAEQDIKSLHAAGMSAEITRTYSGFVEAGVGTEESGRTRLQWVQASEWNFFTPVPDPEFGWRLHMADLAVNKVLAAADRRQVRDYVDLAFIHRNIMPLWHAMWAAPGKDEAWSPVSIAERIAASNTFRQSDIDTEIISTIPISASVLAQTVRAAIDDARSLYKTLPPDTAGRLFIDDHHIPVIDAKRFITPEDANHPQISTIEARRGGAWPSNPTIDKLMIERLITNFGYDGDRTNKPSTTQIKPLDSRMMRHIRDSSFDR